MAINNFFIYLVYYIVLILSFSCTSRFSATKESELQTKSGEKISFSAKCTDRECFTFQDYKGSLSEIKFSSSDEAIKYALHRRLLLLRKFETLIEPYVGTKDAKVCSENLKSDFLELKNNHLYSVVEVPVRGPQRLIHDCLIENNTDWVHIEFIVCQKKFYDIRLYSSLDRPFIDQPFFQCAEHP